MKYFFSCVVLCLLVIMLLFGIEVITRCRDTEIQLQIVEYQKEQEIEELRKEIRLLKTDISIMPSASPLLYRPRNLDQTQYRSLCHYGKRHHIDGFLFGRIPDLAQDRAIAVQSTLMSKGVEATRLRTASFSGEEADKKGGKAERIELAVFQ